jgi:hypothetical protein
MLTHKPGSSIGELLKFTIAKGHQHVGTKELRMMLFGPKWGGFRNGILFGHHHSIISKIIDDSSAEDSSVVLSIESGSRREAANRRA